MLLCIARVFSRSSDLKELLQRVIEWQYILLYSSAMFGGLFDALYEHLHSQRAMIRASNALAEVLGIPVLRLTVEMFHVSVNSFRYTVTEESRSIVNLHFRVTRVTKDRERGVIRIQNDRRRYFLEVRLSFLSDDNFYRGVLIATNLRNNAQFTVGFKIDRATPLRLHDITMTGLSIPDRD